MISLNNITIRRGPNVLLENANWTIYAKQRIGLIGSNGSGKSTLFALFLKQFQADTGNFDIPSKLKLAHVAQETPAVNRSALDYVLDGDPELRELESLLIDAEQQNDGMRIGSIHEQLAAIDAYTAPARAGTLLNGLGFSYEETLKSVSDFSGGWRMRLNLAKALMCRSDMLLLDEPTNHLDLDAVLWLEQWLLKYSGTLLLISHDRDFLDTTVDHIAHISHKQLKIYSGNYSAFETARAADLLLQKATYEKQQRHLAHMQSFVERFRYKASKARQAQSRLKAIERMELVCAVQTDSPFYFEFRTPKHAPNPLIALDSASISYGPKTVLQHLNLSFAPKERIAILGPNGAGKSSLIKLLAGHLQPTHGTYVASSGLKIGYFAQQQVDHLKLSESPLEHLRELAERTPEVDLRKFLGSFGFSGDRIFEAVSTFSGGEKSRLALALIVWQQPNLLLLDEPTNHLDLEMRNALSLALQEYDGAMILVSHDRFLVRTTTDKLLLCAEGKLEEFDGDLNDYQKWLLNYRKQQSNANTTTSKSDVSKKEQRQQSAKQREQLRPLIQKISQFESELKKLQQKVAKAEIALTDQTLYETQHKDKLQEQLLNLSNCKKELEATEALWLAACEERDNL